MVILLKEANAEDVEQKYKENKEKRLDENKKIDMNNVEEKKEVLLDNQIVLQKDNKQIEAEISSKDIVDDKQVEFKKNQENQDKANNVVEENKDEQLDNEKESQKR